MDAKYARVKAGFDLMDKNGDGSLSRTEILTSLMGEQSMRDLLCVPDPESESFEDIYRAMDTDNSGEISWVEFRDHFFPEFRKEVSSATRALGETQERNRAKASQAEAQKPKKKFNAKMMFKKAAKKIQAIRMVSAIGGKEEVIELEATPDEVVANLKISSLGANGSKLKELPLHPFLAKSSKDAALLKKQEKVLANKLKMKAKKIKGAKFVLSKDGGLEVAGRGAASDASPANPLLSLLNGAAETTVQKDGNNSNNNNNKPETTSDQESNYSDLEDAPPNYGVFIELLSCADLGQADGGLFMKGASDPYIVVRVRGNEVHRTGVVYDDCSPTFTVKEHQSKYLLNIPTEDHDQVTLSVYDYDTLGDDEFLGMLRLDKMTLAEPKDDLELHNLEKDPKGSKKKNKLVQGSISIRLCEANEETSAGWLELLEKDKNGCGEGGSKSGSRGGGFFSKARSSIMNSRGQPSNPSMLEPDDYLPPILATNSKIVASVNWCNSYEGSGETKEVSE